tara:strand:+ start:267 stop:491 length:225 start_codon:yes stop_codon:yes gene_type:complete
MRAVEIEIKVLKKGEKRRENAYQSGSERVYLPALLRVISIKQRQMSINMDYTQYAKKQDVPMSMIVGQGVLLHS